MSKGRSLKYRLALWVIGVAVLIFAAIFGICLFYAAREVRANFLLTANSKLDYAITTLDEMMVTAEVSAENLIVVNGETLASRKKKSLYRLLEQFLDANPSVQGVVVGYEHDSTSTGFAPYLMRGEEGNYITLDLAATKDYRDSDWYGTTLLEGSPRWSIPFRESNGSCITSYNVPLRDAADSVYAILAVDLNLSFVSDSLQALHLYPHALVTVLDNDGTFVAHPDASYIMTESLESVTASVPYEPNLDILQSIRSHERDWDVYDDGRHAHFFFHAPAERLGWTVTLDMPRSDIAGGLDKMFNVMLLTMFLGLVLLLGVCIAIISRITRPLEKFASAAREISGGDFHASLPEVGGDRELNDLKEALSSMESSLDTYIAELRSTTEEKAAIEGELNIARSIQMSMIPKKFPPFPDRTEIDVFAMMDPAKAVGGDLYDYTLVGDDLVFCIGDVSGKGVPAALIMAIASVLFRTITKHSHNPAHIAAALNSAICRDNDQNMFITMIIGHCNLRTGEFECCNCGHNLPVTNAAVNGEGIAVPGTDYGFIRTMPTNLPLGVMPDFEFEQMTMKISRGVRLFLYTDGVTEAENASKKLFGDDRLLGCIGGTTSEDLITGVRKAVDEFAAGAEQSDDITMLCFQYMGDGMHLSIANYIEEMSKVGPFVAEVCDRYGISKDVAFQIDVAMDEAVANVVMYSYPEGVKGPVRLSASRMDGAVKFVLENEGVEFDPTAHGEVDTTLSAEDRPIGGLGIFLIKKIMDEVTYAREDGTNVLTMIKKTDI